MVPVTLRDGKKGSVFWPEEFSGNLYRKEPKQSEARHIEFNHSDIGPALSEYNPAIRKDVDGNPVITCGCRDFTIEEARKHWAEDNRSRWTRTTYEWGAIRRMQVEVLVQKARDAGWDVPEETKEEDPYDPELWEFAKHTVNHGKKILSVTPVGGPGCCYLAVTYQSRGCIGANTYADPLRCAGSVALQLKKPKPEAVKYSLNVFSELCGVDTYERYKKRHLNSLVNTITNGKNFLSAYKVEKFHGLWGAPVSLTLEELKAEAA